jgi:hypothetical protein
MFVITSLAIGSSSMSHLIRSSCLVFVVASLAIESSLISHLNSFPLVCLVFVVVANVAIGSSSMSHLIRCLLFV